jgi:hypothetical protein
MIGSLEEQDAALEELRRLEFDDYCREIEADHEREQEWLYEKEPLSPRLTAMVRDIQIKVHRVLQQRRPRPMREWL